MSDFGCGDCSYDTGGGNDGGVCMDLADCTEIAFTENVDYDCSFYDDGGDTFHPVHPRHHTYVTDPKEDVVWFIVMVIIILILCTLNINAHALKFLYAIYIQAIQN